MDTRVTDHRGDTVVRLSLAPAVTVMAVLHSASQGLLYIQK